MSKELKVGDSKRRRDRLSRGGTNIKEGKTVYGAQNKQGIQPRYGKQKGEPDNGHKQEEPHEPSNGRV